MARQHETGYRLYGPEIFKAHCRRHNLRADTIGTLSVDRARTLSNAPREADTMVLPLGTAPLNASAGACAQILRELRLPEIKPPSGQPVVTRRKVV